MKWRVSSKVPHQVARGVSSPQQFCVRHLLETLHVRYQSQRKVADCTATSFTKLPQAFTVLDVNDRFPQTGSLDSVVNRH